MNADSFLENAMTFNPYYPFQKINDQNMGIPVYMFSMRYKKFYLSLLLVGISGIFTIVWPLLGENAQYCMFSIFVLVLCGFHALEYYPIRTIILDHSTKYFTVYRGAKINSCRPVTDLFIKMIVKDIGSKGYRYHLAIDGNGLELPMVLPGETSNKKKLRSLAQKLANNLNINYFDIEETSRHHVVNQERTSPALMTRLKQ